MSGRLLLIVAVLLAPAAGFGQKAKTWTPPRTVDGQPDLQGVWSDATATPLERPSELAGKPVLTEQEAAEFERQTLQNASGDRRDGGAQADVGRAYNEFWRERGKVVPGRRTSLIVDPADGKIPLLTQEAQKKQSALAAARRARGPADGPEDRSLAERCLIWASAGPPMLPAGYNSNFQILQAPGYVVLLNEMIHDARVIPLDGRPHAPSNVRLWMGDSRGRWEGNTLVVDTTNFSEKTNFRGAGPNMHLVERFTRVDPETLVYEFTVDDPTTFTRPWTVSIPSNRIESPIYEYACHEGNYGMTGMLAGARAEEKKAEAAVQKGSR